MDDGIRSVALKSALAEIGKAYADANWLFILTEDGTVITNGENILEGNMAKAAESFQNLAERAKAVGGLDTMLINAEKSKLYVSTINDVHLIADLTQNADLAYFQTLTGAVLPIVLEIVDSLASSPLTHAPTPSKSVSPVEFPSTKSTDAEPILTEPKTEELKDVSTEEQKVVPTEERLTEAEESEEQEEPLATDFSPKELSTDELSSDDTEKPEEAESLKQAENTPSQQLIVDRFSGLMVKADTVQLDSDILTRWSALLNVKEVKEVDIESFGGKTTRCKVKVISDAKLGGRGLIRVPEKTCQTLELRRGELVRVKPVAP